MARPLGVIGGQEAIGVDRRPVGSSSRASDEKGTVRASRWPRVLARLVRMRNSHVLSAARPSKRSRPVSTAHQVSWTTSSATAGVRT
jgi:hypothetical protein